MWKKFYSNSGLILVAILAAGIWFSNITALFSGKRETAATPTPATSQVPKRVDFEAASGSPSPTPSRSAVEIFEQEKRELEKFLSDNPPANATARCADGTYSHSKTRRGACSHHGGVIQWYPQ
jgi:hypothetical protein